MSQIKDAEPLGAQIDRLANFIMSEVPGEPSQSQGAIDTAIRLIRTNIEDANIGRSIISAIGTEVSDPTSPLHDWSPAERYDEVITDLVEMVHATREQAVRECAENVWRPIETAPKDGTAILLYCPQGDGSPGSTYRVTVGDWCEDYGGITERRDLDGRWIDQDESDGFIGWLSWDGGFSEDTMMPTHWQPLPTPPSLSQVSAKK